MQLIMILGYIASGFSAVVLGCLWVPSIECMIGFLVVQVGLIIANAGLKLSVCGGRMVDDARSGANVEPRPTSVADLEDLPMIVILPRPKVDTQPLRDLYN